MVHPTSNLILLFLALVALANAVPHHGLLRRTLAGNSPLRVRTSRGVVEGYRGATANRFTLRYAEPPTGTLRWADPVALKAFGSLYAPRSALQANLSLPVFVWIHGGSFIGGSSTDPGLDGSALSQSQNMTIVTVQYRLGVLGFLKNDALGVSGNFGLQDVVMALRYIQTEIRAFGGDPTSVTLAGQSSGAELIKALLVTPFASKLFHRTIIQAAPLAYPDHSPAIGNAIGASIASNLSCKTLACLRSRPVSTVLATQASLFDPNSKIYGGNVEGASPVEPIRTVVDGKLVTRVFGQVVQDGSSGSLYPGGTPKPMLLTTVQYEACNAVASLFPDPLPNAAFDSAIVSADATRSAAIVASGLYKPGAAVIDGFRNSFTALAGDEVWVCVSQQTAVNLTSGVGAPPVYLAQFNLGISYTNSSVPYCVGKTTHQDDIYVVFGQSPVALSPQQTTLTREVLARWGAFARTGSPNVAGMAVWKPVASATELNLLLLGAAADGSSLRSQVQRPAECQVGTRLWGRKVLF